MTRINAGIPPKNLIDQHLLAEHREIKRVCYHFLDTIDNNRNVEGHEFFTVKKDDTIAFSTLFYLDKGLYTFKRFQEIHNECLVREFNVTDFSDQWKCYLGFSRYYNDWKPTNEQISMLKSRIANRLENMDRLRYRKENIALDRSLKILHGKL